MVVEQWKSAGVDMVFVACQPELYHFLQTAFEQHYLIEGIPARSRAVGTRWTQRSFSNHSMILWFGERDDSQNRGCYVHIFHCSLLLWWMLLFAFQSPSTHVAARMQIGTMSFHLWLLTLLLFWKSLWFDGWLVAYQKNRWDIIELFTHLLKKKKIFWYK